MIILYFLLIPTVYVFLKSIIYYITFKHGKFSYDGFSAAGFVYDPEKDVFYTALDAWQKNFGYCYFYDVMAPIFQMIIDTESVKFYYNNKNWLIVFWKGQYGITTGGEVGIYSTYQKNVDKDTIYMPLDDELFDISFTLYKKGNEIQKISAKHWWLAMFKIGMFSKPKELTMDVSITFPDKEMLSAFIDSFKKLGYKQKDYIINNNTFSFTYKKPHTRKPWTRSFIVDIVRQHYNKKNVKLYNSYMSDVIDGNLINDYKSGNNYIMLQDYLPDIIKNNSYKHISSYTTSRQNVIMLNKKVNYFKHKNHHE